ncbi:MAG TPA: trypsin-like peptidase domain-containing protein [Bacillota bacterium]|nr:trypsin-like peptidase domain-containing protein [Bacillota bacterium]
MGKESGDGRKLVRFLPWVVLTGLLFVGIFAPMFNLRLPGPQGKLFPIQYGNLNYPNSSPGSGNGADGGPVSGSASSPESVAARVSPAVVGIVSTKQLQDWWGDRRQLEEDSGTGVIFDSQGYIFTNNHVIEGTQDIVVSLADGRKLKGQVVGADPTTDLAVVKIPSEKSLPTAALGNSDNLRVGQLAVAIGNPIGMEFQRTVTVGVISGLNRVLQIGEKMFKLIQTDATINPGNSGGPLVNANGEVVGINTIKIAMPKVEGMGFAIPINTAKPIISQLMKGQKISRPWMGLALVSKAEAAQYGIDFPRGMLVIRVVPGSPAADADVREKDIVTSLEGKTVNDLNQINTILQSKKPGELVEITLVRGNEILKTMIRLAEIPSA